MVVNKSIAVHDLLIYKLTSGSLEEILLPSYANWSTKFRGLPLTE